ncbi:MAG: DUF2752 domain-containing protein [Labilithrix sp.]|nr:DUF2752 domain-containing protein [Labilithrix sp.]
MNSSTGPAAEPPNARRGGALRAAALVASAWGIAALPYVLGAARCPTAQLFHVPCPGCGMTRAFHLLAEGALGPSLAMHALAVPTALCQAALAVATVAATARLGAPWALLRARWGRAAVAFAAVVLVADLVYWIARALGAFGGPVPV